MKINILAERINRSRRDLLSSLKRARANHSAFAIRAAQRLETDPAIILGYMVLECGGGAIKLGDKICFLFMKNHFRKKFRKKFPGRELPPSLATGKYTNSKRVWREAYRLWPKGALRNASWGIAQVHPWSYKELGYSSEEEMVKDLTSSARAQEESMINFIRTKGRLHRAIKRKDWWAMGRYYNGDKTGTYGEALRLMYNALHRDNQDAQHIASSSSGWRTMRKRGEIGPEVSGTAAMGGVAGKVYLLGDSNTTPHRRFWKAFIVKNFGSGVQIVDRAKSGLRLSGILGGLEGAEKPLGVIIGSGGGNNATGLGKHSPEKIKSILQPNGAYYQKHIVPLMAKLAELQKKGTKVLFVGLPFGRGAGKKCNNNTPLARETFDRLLAYAANQYRIPYKSVFKETESVKGTRCGVHYGGKQSRQAYRDVLRSTNPNAFPAPREELAYAQSISSGSRKPIKISRNRFLRPYKYLQHAGVNFNTLYAEYERVFGPTWINILLPVHRDDRIFGPEHFAATTQLAQKTNNKKLLAILNKKEYSKEEPIIAKAERAAEKKVDKRVKKAEKSSVSTKPTTAAPVSFEDVLRAGRPGDKFILNFKKEVTWGIFTIFKPNKTYTGSTILPNNKILIDTEKGKHTVTIQQFANQVKSRGEPCKILNCNTSYIIRPNTGRKSFANFLKNPTFGPAKTALTEDKTIVLKIRMR